jgi:hypothetical protein
MPTATTTTSRRHVAAVGEIDPERSTDAPDAVDWGAGEQRHSACPVHRADALRDALAEQRRERERRVDDRRVQPARDRHACYFGADKPATDDDDALHSVEYRLESLRVAELAQRDDSVSHQPRRSRRFAAHGEHEPVVGHTRAVRQQQPPVRRLERSRPHPEPQLDGGVVVGLERLEQETLGVDRISGDQGLGHERAVVRRRGLGGKHAQVPVETSLAQVEGAAHRPHAAAHDDHVVGHRPTLSGSAQPRDRRRSG